MIGVIFSENDGQGVDVVQNHAGAGGNAVQWAFGDLHGHAGLIVDELIKPTEQSAATGKSDALIDDVGGQFRRGSLQGQADGIEDLGERVFQSTPDLI